MRSPAAVAFVSLLPTLVLWDGSVSAFSAVVNNNDGGRIVGQKNSRRSLRRSAVATGDLRSMISSSVRSKDSPTKDSRKRALKGLGIDLPHGLQESLETNADVFMKHIWILDNSGSMCMGDGHQQNLIRSSNGNGKSSQGDDHRHTAKDCTRWGEVQETVNVHAKLASALGAPTDFKLLNPPKSGGQQTFRVGYCGTRRLPFANPFAKRRGGGDPTEQMKHALAKTKPAGMTPLPVCIEQVRSEVVSMLPQLQAEGSKVSIIIATDGCNHNVDNVGSSMTEEERNQELIEALESLQDLPVSVVIRLCTDYKPLVDFYNSLDERFDWDLTVDVLDDHRAESKEVQQHNPWINYALLLHRMREMGHYHPVLDLIDERPLTPREVRDFCRLLFGSYHFSSTSLDEGEEDGDYAWSIRLLEEIIDIQQHTETRKHWNPQTDAMEPWIDIKQLAHKLLDDKTPQLLP